MKISHLDAANAMKNIQGGMVVNSEIFFCNSLQTLQKTTSFPKVT